MSDKLPTNVQLDATANGTVSFATDVVATIAGLAATEVDGVAYMSGNSGLADTLFRKGGNKNLTKGVRVDVQEGKVTVDVTFAVEYGFPVPEVAKGIQENVKKAIETMSGLTVEAVDVHVQSVSFERENKAVAEIEQQQRLLLQKQQEGERDQRLKSDPVAAAEQPKEEPVQPREEPVEEPKAEPIEEPAVEPDEEPAAQQEAGDEPISPEPEDDETESKDETGAAEE